MKFADDYLSNPKVLSLGPLPRLLDVSAIIYSARELRDGQLSRLDVQAVATLARIPRWTAAAGELVRAGRWEPTNDGFAIHDYLTYQPSREQVLAERERSRVRKNAARNPAGHTPDSGGNPAAPYPYPVNSSVSSELSPAGSARLPPRATARAREDPELYAEHERRVAQERASQARPRQPASQISDDDGDGAQPC